MKVRGWNFPRQGGITLSCGLLGNYLLPGLWGQDADIAYYCHPQLHTQKGGFNIFWPLGIFLLGLKSLYCLNRVLLKELLEHREEGQFFLRHLGWVSMMSQKFCYSLPCPILFLITLVIRKLVVIILTNIIECLSQC